MFEGRRMVTSADYRRVANLMFEYLQTKVNIFGRFDDDLFFRVFEIFKAASESEENPEIRRQILLEWANVMLDSAFSFTSPHLVYQYLIPFAKEKFRKLLENSTPTIKQEIQKV